MLTFLWLSKIFFQRVLCDRRRQIPDFYGQAARPKEDRERWESTFRPKIHVRFGFPLLRSMTKSSRRWRVTRRKHILHLGSTSPRGGEIVGGAVWTDNKKGFVLWIPEATCGKVFQRWSYQPEEETLLAKRGGVATSQCRWWPGGRSGGRNYTPLEAAT